MKAIRESCCCPSFVIAIAGPWIAVHGAVLNGNWVVQPLTDMISLQWDEFDERRMQRLGRLFRGLKVSLEELTTFYQTLEIPTYRPGSVWPMIKRVGPYTFEYIETLDEDIPWKLVFKAKMTSPEVKTIVVKFTKSYHSEAHQLLAKMHYAPEFIYYTGDHDYPLKLRGLNIVLMGFVEQNDAGELSRKAQQDVQAALNLLHSKELVFGDLRRPNILQTKAGAMLIDFDWTGKEGEVHYPRELNTSGITWPKDVKPSSQILKVHDWFMFNRLTHGEK